MYDPSPAPAEYDPAHTENEQQKVKNALLVYDYIPMRIWSTAPSRPQVGLYAFSAAGSTAISGTGAGVYYYDGTSYAQL